MGEDFILTQFENYCFKGNFIKDAHYLPQINDTTNFTSMNKPMTYNDYVVLLYTQFLG